MVQNGHLSIWQNRKSWNWNQLNFPRSNVPNCEFLILLRCAEKLLLRIIYFFKQKLSFLQYDGRKKTNWNMSILCIYRVCREWVIVQWIIVRTLISHFLYVIHLHIDSEGCSFSPGGFSCFFFSFPRFNKTIWQRDIRIYIHICLQSDSISMCCWHCTYSLSFVGQLICIRKYLSLFAI